MKTSLRIWTHPKTDEKRIYINVAGMSAKVWITFFEPTPGVASTELHHREDSRYDYPSFFYCEQGIKPWEAVYMTALDEAGLDDDANFKDIINVVQ